MRWRNHPKALPVRTIHLGEAQTGEWYVGLTSPDRGADSLRTFSTRGQAVRAFVDEGRYQPFARMSIRVHGKPNALVLREGRLTSDVGGLPSPTLESVRTAVAKVFATHEPARHRPRGLCAKSLDENQPAA